MANIPDFNIKQISKVVNDNSKDSLNQLVQRKLVLELSGKHVNSSSVSYFRRCSLDDVPTYAFYKDSINIESNTSIFDNDYMRNRLEQLTFQNVNVESVILDEKYYKDVDYKNKDREKDPKDNKVIEVVINQTNSTNNELDVTTNAAKFYDDGVHIKNISKYPDLLIKLRPGEQFNCSMKAVLGCGKRNNIWAAAGNCYFKDLTEKEDKEEDKKNNKFLFSIESQGQLDEYDILKKCCLIGQHKLKVILNKIIKATENDKNINNSSSITVMIDGETHTMGCLINEFLQDSNKVTSSGVSKPDLQKDQIVLKVTTNTNSNVISVIKEVVTFLDELFSSIHKQLVKLEKSKK